MSHRSTPEKELEVQLELYLGIGTFDEMSSDPKNRRFFLFKITRNGQESHKKTLLVFFGVCVLFEGFENLLNF